MRVVTEIKDSRTTIRAKEPFTQNGSSVHPDSRLVQEALKNGQRRKYTDLLLNMGASVSFLPATGRTLVEFGDGIHVHDDAEYVPMGYKSPAEITHAIDTRIVIHGVNEPTDREGRRIVRLESPLGEIDLSDARIDVTNTSGIIFTKAASNRDSTRVQIVEIRPQGKAENRHVKIIERIE